MAKILVLGSSGYIGTHLVPELVQAGHAVKAASRNRDVLIGRNWGNVEIAETNVLSEEGLDEAVQGIDVIYYLVHSMASGKDYAEKDRQAATNVREAASRHKVQRIVYLGGLQPVGTASEHLSSRAETGNTLREGDIPVTELRAGIIVGPGSAGFEVIRDLVNHLRIMITPRWVQSSTQPIALDDLLHYRIQVIDIEETIDISKKDYVEISVKLATNKNFRNSIVDKIKKNKNKLFNDEKSLKFLEEVIRKKLI